MGSRISGEKVVFVQPKPLNEYDPYAASVVEAQMLTDDVVELLAAMREVAAKKNGVKSEQAEAEEPEHVEQSYEEHEKPNPEESAQPEGTGESGKNGYEAGAITGEGLNQLLHEMNGGEPDSGSAGEDNGGSGDVAEGADAGDGGSKTAKKPDGGKRRF